MSDEILIYGGIGIAVLIACFAGYSVWRLGRRRLTAIPAIIMLVAIIVASFLFWYTHRPLPANTTETLFNGVTYKREVLAGPIIAHMLFIDLKAKGIEFMGTPAQATGEYKLAAKTTTQFLTEQHLQIAFNADFFDPWRDYGFMDYYPHVGDGVNVRGLSASRGDVYTQGYAPPENYETLYLTQDNQASFEPPLQPIYNAVSGNMMLVIDGEKTPIETTNDYLTGKHPRTAVALDPEKQTLIVIIIDGRQPNYSEGMTIPELQDLVLANNGYNALNLDGGGSVTLAIAGANGEAVILNSPIHNRIPGRERPIANHLGIFALPIGG
ncbi:MAG: phosphodiester glycosidase family protein [Chloroflexi bacterium]|nr:phosphodiester glycosidase family protein [Chloroflexota bacterium]MCC6896442.1 phosphodiester glycosidase family protein [Anaerolineae bacterium]